MAHNLGRRVGWQIVFLSRSSVGAVFAFLLAKQAKIPLPILRPQALWVRSLAGACVQLCAFYALAHLPATDVVTLRNTSPIWIAVAMTCFGKSPVNLGVGLWVSVFAGVYGVYLLEQPGLAQGNLATWLAFGSSFLVALAMLSLHRLKGVDPRAIVTHLMSVSCLAACFAFALSPTSLSEVSSTELGGLAVMGLFGCLTQLAMSKAYGLGQPVSVSIAGLSQVVFAALFDWFGGSRWLSGRDLLGIGLIVIPGIWLANRKTPPETDARLVSSE